MGAAARAIGTALVRPLPLVYIGQGGPARAAAPPPSWSPTWTPSPSYGNPNRSPTPSRSRGGGGIRPAFLAAKAAHGATQCGPCCWHLTSRNLPQPSTMFHNILEASRTFQKIPELFRYPKYNLPYMKFYLRTIPEIKFHIRQVVFW